MTSMTRAFLTFAEEAPMSSFLLQVLSVFTKYSSLRICQRVPICNWM